MVKLFLLVLVLLATSAVAFNIEDNLNGSFKGIEKPKQLTALGSENCSTCRVWCATNYPQYPFVCTDNKDGCGCLNQPACSVFGLFSCWNNKIDLQINSKHI
jgi:hypothetical protein